jgi:hypothetical protein
VPLAVFCATGCEFDEVVALKQQLTQLREHLANQD